MATVDSENRAILGSRLELSSLGSLKTISEAPRLSRCAPATCCLMRLSTSPSLSDNDSDRDCCEEAAAVEEAALLLPSLLRKQTCIMRLSSAQIMVIGNVFGVVKGKPISKTVPSLHQLEQAMCVFKQVETWYHHCLLWNEFSDCSHIAALHAEAVQGGSCVINTTPLWRDALTHLAGTSRPAGGPSA